METEFHPNNWIDDNGVKWKYTRCFFCHMNCGLEVGVDTETGRIVEIKGNQKEGTVLCDRMGKHGEKAIQFHYHPKRVNHALKRAGEKGEDKWEEIPYEQALDEIADKLKELIAKHGPETLLSSEGTYRSDHLWARSRFYNLLGNPNNIVDPGTICWCWNYTLNMAMTGWPIEGASPVSPSQSNTMVIWGKRATECYGIQSPNWRLYETALKRPGEKPKLIVVDPMQTEEARLADHWQALYPGTDAALILGWANYILENDLYDEEFLKYWSNAVFLVRKDDGQMIRADWIDPSLPHTDFVAWDTMTDKMVFWNSDENHYYGDVTVEPALMGEFTIDLADEKDVEVTTSFAALRKHLSKYDLETVSEITGVPVTQIRDAAHCYATNGPAFIAWGLGGGDQAGWNAAACAVGKTLLRIITGNIDNPGGEYVGEPGLPPTPGEGKLFPMRDSELELSDVVKPETRKKFLGNDQFRCMSWKGFEPIDKAYRKMFDVNRPQLHQMLVTPPVAWKAVEEGDPYKCTAMICWSSNPMAWAPNSKHVYEVLKKLELLVVVDYWKTPTAALADYILPAADCLERPMGATCEDSNDFSVYGDRAVPPEFDRRVDYDFFRGLALRMGQEEYWPWETYEDVIAYRIERCPDIKDFNDAVEIGMYFPGPTRFYKHAETLPNGQTRGFATTTRKCEIYPTLFQDLGYNPYPEYREPWESPVSRPDLAQKYPLRLTVSGRTSILYHSEWRVPGQGTRSMYPWPNVIINAHDAHDLGITDGEWVWIETPRGRIRQVAKVDASIIPGTVQVMPSWWFPELPAEEPWSQGVFESNGNVLTPDDIETLDPMCGNWIDRGLLCRVYPCIDPEDRTDQYVTGEDYARGDTYFDEEFAKLGFWEIEKMDEDKTEPAPVGVSDHSIPAPKEVERIDYSTFSMSCFDKD